MTRFRTNRRLWLTISLVLFIVPWFIPLIELQPKMAPARLWLGLFDPRHFSEVFVMLVWWILLFGVPAIAVGWVLQCLIILIRAAKRNNESRG
jgi:hypothetical protein